MFKSELAKILWIVLVVLFLLTLPVLFFTYQIITPQGEAEERAFEIKQGDSLTEIAYNLKKENFIRSSFCFKLLGYLSKNADNIKFGEYRLNSGMNSVEILRKILKGEVIMHLVTIPEGYTLKQIAELLETSGVSNKEDFLKAALNNKLTIYNCFAPENLEGYLFPDSYSFAKNTPPDLVIDKMLSSFKEKVFPLFKEKNNPSANGLSFNQLITLASMIEAEARVDSERPVIASVYYNRLKEGWPLECDATIQYVLQERKFNLRFSDLKIISPYNTYLNKGLPPAPIGAPGISSIKAAVHPSKTGYFFYVRNDLKNDGSHIFTKSYSQHLAAIKKYQKY